MSARKFQKHQIKPIGISLLTFFLGFSLASSKFLSSTLTISPNLISLNSTQGEQLLLASTARQDYLPLSAHFVAQQNPAYCGVASMVMVLNALSIPAPEAPELGFHVFTQNNVFNEQMRQVRSPLKILLQGMTLDQLAQLLQNRHVQVEVRYASDLTLDEFRAVTVKNLQQVDNFVIVNYLRSSINQQQWGHISPIAAYHRKSDRFLLLDVARDKYPPVWVKASELWQAMATRDSESGKTRGIVLVSVDKKSL